MYCRRGIPCGCPDTQNEKRRGGVGPPVYINKCHNHPDGFGRAVFGQADPAPTVDVFDGCFRGMYSGDVFGYPQGAPLQKINNHRRGIPCGCPETQNEKRRGGVGPPVYINKCHNHPDGFGRAVFGQADPAPTGDDYGGCIRWMYTVNVFGYPQGAPLQKINNHRRDIPCGCPETQK